MPAPDSRLDLAGGIRAMAARDDAVRPGGRRVERRSGAAETVHRRHALLFVHAFVEADLSEEIGHGVESGAVVREGAGEREVLPVGVLRDEQCVLMLGVVLEVGVEPVAPRRTDDVEQTGQLVVDKGQGLGEQAELDPRLAHVLAGYQLLVKRSISLPADVFEALELQAAEEGRTVSAALADAADLWLSTRRGLRAMRAWEREHGALTADELAGADRALDRARVGRH